MKKILLLSSIFCVFLSACGNASVPAAPTSTLPPPATVTVMPPATATIPPTEAPTAEPTIAPTEGPAKVETLVEKIPFVSSDIVFSQAFDEQIIKDEAAGKFPRNPNAKPLTSCNILPEENNLLLSTYGEAPLLVISSKDIQVYKNNNENKPWSLAKLVKTEKGGVKFFVGVVRIENPDKQDGTKTSAGFFKGILLTSNQNITNLKLDKGFDRAFGTGNYFPTGEYWDPKRPDALHKLLAYYNMDDDIFVKFIQNQQKIAFDKNFWKKCEETGVINNIITGANGQSDLLIPTVVLSSVGY